MKVAKLVVKQRFFDIESSVRRNAGEQFEATEKRAGELAAKGLVVVVDVVKVEAPKKPKVEKPKKEDKGVEVVFKVEDEKPAETITAPKKRIRKSKSASKRIASLKADGTI